MASSSFSRWTSIWIDGAAVIRTNANIVMKIMTAIRVMPDSLFASVIVVVIVVIAIRPVGHTVRVRTGSAVTRNIIGYSRDPAWAYRHRRPARGIARLGPSGKSASRLYTRLRPRR